MNTESILIRANAKRNGLTCLLLGAMGIVVSSLWLTLLPEWLFLSGIFLLSASFVCALVGWYKLGEPEFSFLLAKDAMTFCHRKGSWCIRWNNIQRVDCPTSSVGWDHVQMELVGIRLKDYASFLATLSPRLAMHLLVEQRPLLLHALRKNCQTGNCYENHFLNDDNYLLPDGSRLTGINAMFAHRMAQLRQHYGFDLMVAASDLDREPERFVTLLRDCQSHSVEVSS